MTRSHSIFQCNLLGNSHYIIIEEYTFENIIQVLIETGSTSGSQVYWQIGCKGNYDDWRMTTTKSRVTTQTGE